MSRTATRPTVRPTTRPVALAAVLALGASLLPLALGGSVPATAAVTTPSAAATTALSPSDQLVHDNLTLRSTAKRLGSDLAGLVTDAETGQVLWSRTPNERQLPASNAKLVTAVNALSAFGPDHRFTTKVVRGKSKRGLVLVGVGDPSLSRRNLTTLATTLAPQLAAKGIATVMVNVDDSLFPPPTRIPFGWKSSYVPDEVRAVRALVVNQHQVRDTSMDAGRVFAKRLRAQGIHVSVVRRRTAPAGARLLAAVQGRPMSQLVAYMLTWSDNDYAEALHRLVALKTGRKATWGGARVAQRRRLAHLGVDLGDSVLYDGSGLSRADRLKPLDVVRVLSLAFDGAHPRLTSLQDGSLAVAGRTGTLSAAYLRYVTRPSSCAVGLIQGKTGSLHGVISLSGFAQGADGRVKLFSFLLNRVPSTLQTRRAVDKLATTITGCW